MDHNDFIMRGLQSLGDETALMMIDPDATECPGCGKRFYEDWLIHTRELLNGETRLVCPECADDADEDRPFEAFLAESNFRTKYRGLPIEGFLV